MKRLLLIVLIPLLLSSPVYASEPWSGDWLAPTIAIEVTENVTETTTYIPFKSVQEMYDYALTSEVAFREYIYGVYDCINYLPPDNYFGFALDFIEEAKQNRRYFITDYELQGGGKWTLRVMAFAGNRLYALYPYDLTKYPILLGTAD